MKILHLAFLNGDPQNMQFFRKVDAQFRAGKKLNSSWICYVLGENYSNLDFSEFGFCYLDFKEFVFRNAAHRRKIQYRMAAELIRFHGPDLVYCRYPWADFHLYQLVRKYPNFVFEHQTKEIPELTFNKQYDILRNEKAYGSQVLSFVKGIVAVTGDCRDYKWEQAGHRKPAYTMTNGIDTERIHWRREKQKESSTIQILCLASFALWHGYDRLIEGVRLFKGTQKFLIHMVGGGPQLHSYQALVRRYSLESYFHFWGRMDHDSYQHIVESAHIAVGSLGLHRMNLHFAASLKNREYCAGGLPFCFAGSDSDFGANLPFVFRVPACDDPLDLGALLDFAREVSSIPNLSSLMRRFAEENLSWKVKIKGLLSFLNSLGVHSPDHGQKAFFYRSLGWRTILPRWEKEFCSRTFPSVESMLTRASIQYVLGNKPGAITSFRTILDRVQTPRPFLFRCLVELEKLCGGDGDLFRDYSFKVLELYSKKKRFHPMETYRLASLYEKWGFSQRSITLFTKIINTGSASFSAGVYFHLGDLFFKQKELGKAREMLQKCLAVLPEHREAKRILKHC
jgi:hypothetical protein